MSTVRLEVGPFKEFISKVRQFFGDSLQVIVLPAEMEDMIFDAFMHGQLSDVVSYDTDRHGKILMRLDKVKTMFTSKVTLGRPLFVLNGGLGKAPDGANPVFPSTGPGGGDGGSPIPAAQAA